MISDIGDVLVTRDLNEYLIIVSLHNLSEYSCVLVSPERLDLLILELSAKVDMVGDDKLSPIFSCAELLLEPLELLILLAALL